MAGKTKEETFMMWAVIITLMGTVILLSTHSVYRGFQMDNLEAELEELKLVVFKLQQAEENVEIELQRTKRQIDLASRPEVLDYAYNAKLPESTANLSVYSRWQTKPNSGITGVSDHHKVSAAWVGDAEDRGDPENWNNLFEHQNDQQYSHNFGVGEAFDQGQDSSSSYHQNYHRRSRVASTGGQGVLIEVSGRLAGGGQNNFNVVPKAQKITRTTATTARPTTRPATTSAPPTYKRPQLKSLGTPDRATTSSTAIQLEAGSSHDHSSGDGLHLHWKLARWARRLGADGSFPVSRGRVGVPSPGLYLIYAQVTYTDKHRHQGFSVMVNDNPALECQEHRGVALGMMCHTGGLLYLEQGDRVSIRDSKPNRKIDTGTGKTFFGLVKLTRDWI